MPKWEAGQSGNPHGRPRKDNALSDLLRKALGKTGEDGVRNRESIVGEVVRLARLGEEWAVKLVWDRIEGRPAQAVQLTDGEGGPALIRVIGEARKLAEENEDSDS